MLKRILTLMVLALTQAGCTVDEGGTLFEPFPLTPESRIEWERLKRLCQEGKRKLTESAREFPKASTLHSPDGPLLAGCGKTIVARETSIVRMSGSTGKHFRRVLKRPPSHPSNPGAPRRAVPRARPQGRCSFCNVSRICRTKLADFFSTLLEAESRWPARRC